MLLRESEFDRATELFYEAAALPELWPQALAVLADASGAMGVCLYPIGPGPDGALCTPRIKGIIEVFLSSGWLKINPYMRRGLELTAAGKKGLITSEEMLTPEETARDTFVNEFQIPIGLGSRAGVVLATSSSELAIPIVFERSPTDDPYSRGEIAKMNRLVAKLKPAAALALNAGFSAAKKVVDGLTDAGRELALLGASGRVLHMPTGFERYIGDVFHFRHGRLSSWDANAERLLAGAVQKATGNAPAGERAVRMVALPRKSGRRPLIAQVVPITRAAQDVFMLARAVIILTDPDAGGAFDPVDSSLAALGLTPAEARLARRIGSGEELKDAAEAENISLETARSRLKAVFAKTNTHRQVELALWIARLPR